MIFRLVEDDLQVLFDLRFGDFCYGTVHDQAVTTVEDGYESTFSRMASI